MLYKANFANGFLNVEEVVGYAEAGGTLVVMEDAPYFRRLGDDGVMFDGSAYGSTAEKAVNGLIDDLSISLAIARMKVDGLEQRLAMAKAFIDAKASA